MKYFLTEVLGYKESSGKAAALGTCLHKIMEVLALAKIKFQETGEKEIEIEEKTIGKYTFNSQNWSKAKDVKHLKATYNVCSPNEIRDIFDLVFAYSSNLNSSQDWGPEEKDNILKWTYICLNEKHHKYDPRRRTVVQPEKYLSHVIDEQWAKYDWGHGVEGFWKLNGIIDVIYKNDDNSHEIVDYKTGQRKCWNSGTVKNLPDLQKDIQLMSYYYLMHKLYPEITNVSITIFYVKDGGPFQPYFGPEDLPRIEEKLKNYYSRISSCTMPKQLDPTQRNFKCKKFCEFATKYKLDGKCLCAAVADRIKKDGIEKVADELRQ